MSENSGTKDLAAFLDQIIASDGHLEPAAKVLHEIATASVEMSNVIRFGALGGRLGESRANANAGGDVQKELDVLANDLFLEAFKWAPVAGVVSEELEEPLILDAAAPLAVMMDPLDGSSNIDTNVSIGTIFSIVPMLSNVSDSYAHFLQPGRAQIAAGFVIYGPQTSMVFALGSGSTQLFTLDQRYGQFFQVLPAPGVPGESAEYAINASNYRHWEPPVRAFIDDCEQGVEGPLKREFNMRWTGSLVADACRIISRGGVFLYPGDERAGYGQGRLRLLYEANPVALVIERAGGSATDCLQQILDIIPASIHARVPFVFGSPALVELIARYHSDPQFSDRAPLFGKRGLMRR